MQPYITYREMDEAGRLCYYVCQKQFPHYCGVISMGKIDGSLACSPIPEYNLYVCFNGCIQGYVVPGYNDVIENIEAVMTDMAVWYYRNRIKTEPKKYLKFKITT